MKNPQRGSVLFYILIAVALIAALTYAVNNSSRNNVSTINEQQLSLASQAILEQGQKMADAVQKLTLRGIRAEDISFENPVVEEYQNARCADAYCRVFNPNGGGLNWLQAPASANDGESWLYTGTLPIEDNGTSSHNDLTMILPGVSEALCRRINVSLGISENETDPVPETESSSLSADKYSTAHPMTSSGDMISSPEVSGRPAACVRIDNTSGDLDSGTDFYFIQTIYAG
jgi:hypothetical protein